MKLPFHKPTIDWNHDYSLGRYDGFDDAFKGARYALLGGIIRKEHPASVLDIGCGYGGLREFLPACSYTGLEISQVALDGIHDRRPGDRFVCSDVEAWEPDATFDVVVFSEVLYYLKNIDATLSKITGHLTRGGMILASFYNHPSFWSPDHAALGATRLYLSTDPFQLSTDLKISSGRKSWSIVGGVRPI